MSIRAAVYQCSQFDLSKGRRRPEQIRVSPRSFILFFSSLFKRSLHHTIYFVFVCCIFSGKCRETIAYYNCAAVTDIAHAVGYTSDAPCREQEKKWVVGHYSTLSTCKPQNTPSSVNKRQPTNQQKHGLIGYLALHTAISSTRGVDTPISKNVPKNYQNKKVYFYNFVL